MGFAINRNGDDPKKLLIIGAWTTLFLGCVFAYLPGLDGPFVFDDLDSIGALGKFGSVRDWETFKAFVLDGVAGPTGRPLAMLSFLIDGTTWPTDPWPFKRTNLIIHLLNGVLLGILISKILALLNYERRDIRCIAFVSTASWLLHPFLVSTTLYVVQRMAQLSAFFIFAGLLGHLYGRSMLASDTRRAYLLMSLSIGFFTLLAMLSKENGILLPALIGVIEFTVFASQQNRIAALDRRWLALFVLAPSSIIAAYLGARLFRPDFFDIVAPRDFSMYERLLTQPRILFDYLQHWFIPKLYTTGIFQDHFIKSTGLLSPITTLLSAVSHLAIIAFAIIIRRKSPLVALAFLFFYASHALESSTINLELYFEHRNYLAAVFLLLPLVAQLRIRVRHRLFVVAALGLTLVLGLFTHYSATVWQDYSSMVAASARKAPTSARAQAEFAKDLFNDGRYEESLIVVDRAIKIIPGDKPHLLLNRLMILCRLNLLNTKEFDRVAKQMSQTTYDPRLASIYIEFASAVTEGACPGVSVQALRRMFVAMLNVTQNSDPRSVQYALLKYLVGFLDIQNGKPDQAVAEFEASLQAQPKATTAMNMAALLATSAYFQEALYISNLALAGLAKGPEGGFLRTSVSESDIRDFQAIVRADMSGMQEGDTSHPTP